MRDAIDRAHLPAGARTVTGGGAAWALAAAAAVLLVLRATTIMSPLMAGDAYAYFAHARMAGRLDALYAADPAIQRVNNPLFFSIGGLACRLAGGDGTLVLRVLNVALFVAGCGLCASLVRRPAHRWDRVGALGLLLATPLSSYCHCFMPEIVYFFLVMVLSVVVVRGPGPVAGTSAVAAGAVLGGLLGTKPHAVAIAAALAAFVLFQHVRGRGWRGLGSAARALAAVAAAAGIVWAAVTVGFHGVLPQAAAGAVGADYARFLVNGARSGPDIAQIAAVLLRHGLVNGSVFAVPVLLLARWLADQQPRAAGSTAAPDAEEAGGGRPLALWSLAVLGTALAMSVVFTALLARSNPAEATRVHGRYYSFALPLVLAAWAAAYPAIRGRPWFPRWAAGAAAVGAACGFGMACCGDWVTIYPWDYPELLGLSRWPALGRQVAVLPWALAAAAAAAAVLIAIRPGWTLWVVGTLIAGGFVAGQYNVWQWHAENTAGQGRITREARAVATLLPPDARDRGLVVGERRHGRMAFALYGLMANSRVLVRPALAVLSRRDVPPDVEWILTTDPIAVDLPCRSVVAGQETTFYRLMPITEPREGSTLVVDAGPQGEAAAFVGFNAGEPWGRWSALPVARVLLPGHVAGPVTVRMRCWGARPEAQRLVVELGSGAAAVAVDGTPQTHACEIDAGDGGSVVTLRGVEPVRPNPWDRPLGVAVQWLEIEPRQAPAGAAGGGGTGP
jgi:hypothetical protein